MRSIVLLIENLVNNCRYFRAKYIFFKRYRKVCRLNNIENKVVEGEDDWIKKWHQLDPHISSLQYRVFSKYIGTNQNIVPEETSHFFVEPILNSKEMSAFYSDKNMFDKIIPQDYLPRTVLRRINGFFYDAAYRYISLSEAVLKDLLISLNCSKIIIKPTVGGESGKGVQLFILDGIGGGKNVVTNEELSVNYLTSMCDDNFIIQEAVQQHDYINQFNSTSVNTLRLAIYRSVTDNQCHVVGAIMRIGASGCVVDNAHAGGCFVGIKSDGTFCNFVCNQYGQTFQTFNGVSFTKAYKYPNWDKVIDFGKEVALHLIHNRLVALDIALNNEGKPVLIEYNITPGTYSMWLFQYTTSPAYGEFADEIINYCINKQR